jgi:hypothetical protein
VTDTNVPKVRRGQGDVKLTREEFARRIGERFYDPAFDSVLIQAGGAATVDRHVGSYEPYATSHDALDADVAVMEEVRNVAQSLVNTVLLLRDGGMRRPDDALAWPRPK